MISATNTKDTAASAHCSSSTDPEGRRAKVVQGGDSGAWVVDDLSGSTQWYGMVVAQQGAFGYGCFADYIMSDLRRRPGFPERLVPQW